MPKLAVQLFECTYCFYTSIDKCDNDLFGNLSKMFEWNTYNFKQSLTKSKCWLHVIIFDNIQWPLLHNSKTFDEKKVVNRFKIMPLLLDIIN